MLAAIRPDDFNFPLLLHVLGATVTFGALIVAVTALVAARGGETASLRLGYRTLLLAALPSYIVMRAAAQWIADKEGVTDSDAAWVGIGYMTAEGGLLFVVIATVLSGLAVRKADTGGAGVRVATGLIAVTLLAHVVAVWAMTTKPI